MNSKTLQFHYAMMKLKSLHPVYHHALRGFPQRGNAATARRASGPVPALLPRCTCLGHQAISQRVRRRYQLCMHRLRLSGTQITSLAWPQGGLSLRSPFFYPLA